MGCLYLGRHLLPNASRKAGAAVEIHDDHFEPDAPDEEWLGEVGRNNWAVLTKDLKIRYRAMERDALIRGRVRVFAVTSGHLGGQELAELLVAKLPRILHEAKTRSGPFFAKVTRTTVTVAELRASP